MTRIHKISTIHIRNTPPSSSISMRMLKCRRLVLEAEERLSLCLSEWP